MSTEFTDHDLLECVRNAEIWQEPDGTNNLYLREVFGMSDPYAEVTDGIRALEKAELVQLVDAVRGGRVWRLTTEGERQLYRMRHPSLVDRLIDAARR